MRAFVCSLLSAAVKLQSTNRSCLDGRVEDPVQCRLGLADVTCLGPVADVPEAGRECLGHRDLRQGSNWTKCLLVMLLFDLHPAVDSSGIEGDSPGHKAVELLWETLEAIDMSVSTPTSARGSGHYPVRVKVVKAAGLRRFPLQALQSLAVGCAWQFIQPKSMQKRVSSKSGTDLAKGGFLNGSSSGMNMYKFPKPGLFLLCIIIS